MSIQTLPILPSEVMSKILFEFKGLKHPVYTLEKTKICEGCGEYKKENDFIKFDCGEINEYFDENFEEYCSRHCAWENGNVIDLENITVHEIDEYFDGNCYPSFMEESRDRELEYWVEEGNDEEDEDGFEEFFDEYCKETTFNLTLKIDEDDTWYSVTDEGFSFKSRDSGGLVSPKREWVNKKDFGDEWNFK